MPGRTIRLVSYNLLEGLRTVPTTPASDVHPFDEERVVAARRVVDDLSPDVLVLNEALYCLRHAGRRVDYAALFGYPHQVCALYGDAWGNAVLSRFPVVRHEEMRIHNRGGVMADLDTPDGPLAVGSYHPHPGRYPGHKALDFVRLLGQREGPRLVAGDMNAVSPADDPDRDALVRAFSRFDQDPAGTVDRFLDSGRAVFGALENLGLRDAMPDAARRYTIPTDLLSTDKGSGIRIDHVLVSDEIEVLDGGVARNPETERASDHYPVWIDLRLREASP
ncbi:MAG: endonuclease/exonuclease/phosphatase family protein [Myxococcota bacterium]